MTEKLITALMLIVAIIHIVPIAGVSGVAKLELLYGTVISGNELEILMRHRAVLFGILGVFFAYAAFSPSLQPIAFLAAFASISSFFYLSFSVGNYNQAIQKIVLGDIIAAISLFIAVVLFYTKTNN